jgi:hypothetical protein
MNMKAKIVVVFGLLAAAFQGCAAGAGSCTISSTNSQYCIEYLGSSYTADSVKAACASGTYSASACATGSGKQCVFQKGTTTEYRWVFSTADGGALSPESLCTSAGGTYE